MRRAAAATVLTGLALGLPCAAWWVVGSRDAEREARRLEDEPTEAAREAALRLAERLGARLEALREVESRRPFYHYQTLYHDPKGAHEGASVVLSPLAEGPSDPLIATHFQVDPQGKVTLPQYDEEFPELAKPTAVAEQQALRDELQATARYCATVAATTSEEPKNDRPQEQVLAKEAWEQNSRANDYYTQIKRRAQSSFSPSSAAPVGSSEEVKIRTDPLVWRTVPVRGRPALVALRRVVTPTGVRIQGLEISTSAVEESLRGAFPARFTSGTPTEPASARIALPGAEWSVVIDAASARVGAAARARDVRASFVATFAAGSAAAALAGLCVVALTWQAERLARQRSQFAAMAAHELRTPLAGLRMYGDMLAEGLGEPTRQRDYARRVSDEAARLGRVVSNVLGFSRLERGTLAVRPERAELVAAVRDVLLRHEPALVALGAGVQLEAPPEDVVAAFDRDALGEIVQNLLDNAEKYTRGTAKRTIRVIVAAEPGRATVTVRDEGPGVPRAARARLFRPFERAAGPDSPAGLGLGLALARALARAQGGTLAYRDAAGGGAAFELSLVR